ncbi:hypothetical protein Vadar_017734 [Vaccinium darrowii]|uniref:Uncharacterized protein n=1 Tax=Vaccinium darrowii TaxID=229202 RepID=A0ACB7ZEK8_9ERIC|nr:hypothetical protein Vadar_017734 [Vaccinium darrowii]
MEPINPINLDDDLSNRFRSFKLTSEEQSEVTLIQDDVKFSEEECRSSLFGKIISQKPVNFSGLRTTMGLVWGNPKNFRVIEVGKGIYQFILPSEVDVIRILNGKPWFFNNHFLILERWNPKLQPSQYCFNFTPIWVQIWGLPIQFISTEVGLKLGSNIGTVEDVAIPVTGSKEGRFVRVRVYMDISVPLRRGCMVKLAQRAPFWVEFRYERLPMFCRYCGMVGHEFLNCDKRFFDIQEDELRDAQYGPWIRASPSTHSSRNKSGPTPSRHSSSGESSMAGSENLAADKVGQYTNSFSKIVSKGGTARSTGARNSNSAHEELVAESRIQDKFSDLLPIQNNSPDGLTPAQEKALQIWRASNPIKASAQYSKTPAVVEDPITSSPSPITSIPLTHMGHPQNTPTLASTKVHPLTSPPLPDHVTPSQNITPKPVSLPSHSTQILNQTHGPTQSLSTPPIVSSSNKPDIPPQSTNPLPSSIEALDSAIPLLPTLPSLSTDLDQILVDAPISTAAPKRFYRKKKGVAVSSHGMSIPPALNSGKRKFFEPTLGLEKGGTHGPPIIKESAKRRKGEGLLANGCSGVGRPLTFHQLKEFSKLHSPSLFFLSETKNGVTRMEVVKRALGMDGSLWVEPAGLAGGLAVFWKGAQTVEVQRMCSWFIDVKVQATDGGSSWRLINVYFSSRVEVRKAQWDVFVQYKDCLGEDWAIWGDMNNIVSTDEKQGGVLPVQSNLRDFQDFINTCHLLDLGFSGYPFTWRNNREGEGFIQERLDRVLVSPSWRTRFPHAAVEHLDAIGSDHSALLLQLLRFESPSRAPFRFDARWVQEEELIPVIQGAWNTQVQGSRFFNVHQKIKTCRVSIQNWKKRKRLNSGQRIKELKDQIQSIQNEQNLHSRGNLQELRNLLRLEWDKEEMFWRQKSRINWLRQGDRNTSFFHASVLQRRARNRITGIENSAGEWISGKAEIMSEFQQFFKGLFSANLELNMEHTIANIPSKVTSEMNSRLTRQVTAEEIHDVLMAMHPSKAPGVDEGLHHLFRSAAASGDMRGIKIGQMDQKIDVESLLERPELHWVFIRNVYSILAIQLLIIIAVADVVIAVEPISVFLTPNHSGFVLYFVLVFIGFTALGLLAYYYKRHPLNYFLLAISTIATAFVSGLAYAFTYRLNIPCMLLEHCSKSPRGSASEATRNNASRT